jgi:hypothetical protein
MTDGMIGHTSVVVPDLMDRVIAFRSLNYVSHRDFRGPNEFKIDIATGKIVPNWGAIKAHEDLEGAVGELHSPQYNRTGQCVWGKEMTASCGAGHKHKAPNHSCHCGLYCYYSLQEISFEYSYRGSIVYCCVSCEGGIEAHSTGMRVEKMTIEAVYALSHLGLSDLLKSLEIAFFPIESYTRDQFLNACQEYGDPLPKSLRAGSEEEKELPF